MGYKSLIVTMEITTAGRGHYCRYNKRHRIEKGDKRLTVRSDGNEHRYCLPCGRIFLTRALERLRFHLQELEAALSNS